MSPNMHAFCNEPALLLILCVLCCSCRAQVLPTVDIILLTHCTLAHLGALPYILSHHQTHAQVYATAPTHKMGLLVMMDQYHARHAMQDFDTFTPADISAAFARVRQLKYQQFVRLAGESSCEGDRCMIYADLTHLVAGRHSRLLMHDPDLSSWHAAMLGSPFRSCSANLSVWHSMHHHLA